MTEEFNIDSFIADMRSGDSSISVAEIERPSQRKVAEKFLKQVAERNARTGNTDLKQLEVTATSSGLIFIVVEYGLPNDEGTMASIICRDRRHVMLRQRGGIELLNAKRKSWSYGLWCAVHELTK